MIEVDLEDAKLNLIRLIEQVESGMEVVITKDARPAVKLVPASPPKHRRQPGSAKGLVTISDDFDEPLEDFKDYM